METKSKFRTHFTQNDVIKEHNNGVAPDFVDKDFTPLSDIIERFNRGQRLTGINYNLNDNLISDKAGSEFDDPDALYPIRCDDIVDVVDAQKEVASRKAILESRKLKKETQTSSEQVDS